MHNTRESTRAGMGRFLIGAALGVLLAGAAAATAPRAAGGGFEFRTNDVIAFVGGEDVVEMQRNGYFELLITAAKRGYNLRFRSLAFEGDTVLEQHRQLNFPSSEKQFEQIGATVVIAQFGQAESLRGTNGLAAFETACARLLDRFAAGGRRVVLLPPTPFGNGGSASFEWQARSADLRRYEEAIVRVATSRPSRDSIFPLRWEAPGSNPREAFESKPASTLLRTRDGLHLDTVGHERLAQLCAQRLQAVRPNDPMLFDPSTGAAKSPRVEIVRRLIMEKNRLWFDYFRPQNWAFLNGDRIEQPSSHDHRDAKRRWFPEEMQKFLPLIEAKEKEIWAAVEKP
jgi:hypothetical protein